VENVSDALSINHQKSTTKHKNEKKNEKKGGKRLRRALNQPQLAQRRQHSP
jgi:hypothetical protein